jgi:hypothetical protein
VSFFLTINWNIVLSSYARHKLKGQLVFSPSQFYFFKRKKIAVIKKIDKITLFKIYIYIYFSLCGRFLLNIALFRTAGLSSHSQIKVGAGLIN